NTMCASVATAASTGERRNEIHALKWSVFDPEKKTLRIERSVEESRGVPAQLARRLKEPKRASHKRTIAIDDSLIALLLSKRDKHLRLAAGVPRGAAVDLSLIKLPEGRLDVSKLR